ncbi:PAS domain-containing protein, partial [Rhizobium sp. BR5]
MLAFVRKKCLGVFVLGDKTDSDNALGYYMWSISDNRLIMDAVTAECHGFS